MKRKPLEYATWGLVAGALYTALMLMIVHPHNDAWVIVPITSAVTFVALLLSNSKQE